MTQGTDDLTECGCEAASSEYMYLHMSIGRYEAFVFLDNYMRYLIEGLSS